MAMESPRVTADVIEIQEFPDLAALYNIMGVPKTIINDRVQFTGAVPEDVLLQRLLQAVGAEESDDGPEQYSDMTTPIS
jgi:predicted DsbA family dithiol-disulfide isomerase